MKNNLLLIVAILGLTGVTTTANAQSGRKTVQAPATPAAIARAAFQTAKTPGSPFAQKKDNKTESGKKVAQHLATFDDLDYNVFSSGKWNELSRSHSADVVVHWPDGRVTRGIETHIKDLKALFVFAPDTRIQEHPIKIGQGDYTSVVGVFEGTFTQPMPTPDGKSIPPTGKAFKLLMCTVAHWKNGVMDEEHLFWDNAEFAKQIGLTK